MSDGPRFIRPPYRGAKMTIRVEHSPWSWHVIETEWKGCSARAEAARDMLVKIEDLIDALPAPDAPLMDYYDKPTGSTPRKEKGA